MGWLTGWRRRKKQTITGTAAGAQTNYQMKMTVHKGSGVDSATDVYCGGACRDDFGDIRWTKDDGATEMDYWMESLVSGDQAVFWVEVPSIPASPGTVDVYMYFDKSDAVTTSSGAATFPFFDDFDDLSNWTTAAGSPSASGSELVLPGSTPKTAVRTTSATFGLQTAFRFRANIQGGKDSQHSYANSWLDPSDASESAMMGDFGTATNITFRTRKAAAATTSNTASWTWGSYAIFEIKRTSSSSAKLMGSDSQIYEHTTNISTDSLNLSHGGGVAGGVDTLVAWSLVRNYVEAEPTWGSWGSLERLFSKVAGVSSIGKVAGVGLASIGKLAGVG